MVNLSLDLFLAVTVFWRFSSLSSGFVELNYAVVIINTPRYYQFMVGIEISVKVISNW